MTPGGRHVVTMVLCRAGCVRRGGPVCAGQARCADAVRGCPCGSAARSPRARTYSGQRRHSEHHPVTFAQVRWYMEVQAGAYSKAVGSAYVGSNPTPATRFRRLEPVTPDGVTGFRREKGAVTQAVGCAPWAMRGPDPAARSRCTQSRIMPSELRKHRRELASACGGAGQQPEPLNPIPPPGGSLPPPAWHDPLPGGRVKGAYGTAARPFDPPAPEPGSHRGTGSRLSHARTTAPRTAQAPNRTLAVTGGCR